MTQSNSRTRRAVDPRLEAMAAQALENTRGRAAFQPQANAGKLARSVLGDLLKDQGVGIGDLQRHWQDIVGDRLSGLTAPEKLTWSADGYVLTVKAHASAAPFVQHQSKLIIERANLAGARIKALQIRQGAPPARQGNVAPVTKPLSPEEEAAIVAALSRVAPGRLRDALLRLGRAVAAR
jgi:hypothetical protein